MAGIHFIGSKCCRCVSISVNIDTLVPDDCSVSISLWWGLVLFVPFQFSNTLQTHAECGKQRHDRHISCRIVQFYQPEELDLGYKKLTGSLTSDIGRLWHLEELDLFYNQFEGMLPCKLGHFFFAKKISLGKNRFTGTIPSMMAMLPVLEVLSLQNEYFEHKPNAYFSAVQKPFVLGKD